MKILIQILIGATCFSSAAFADYGFVVYEHPNNFRNGLIDTITEIKATKTEGYITIDRTIIIKTHAGITITNEYRYDTVFEQQKKDLEAGKSIDVSNCAQYDPSTYEGNFYHRSFSQCGYEETPILETATIMNYVTAFDLNSVVFGPKPLPKPTEGTSVPAKWDRR